MKSIDFSPYTSKIQTISVDNGQIILNSIFAEKLNEFDCICFDDIFKFSGGELVKEKDGLEIRKATFGSFRYSIFIKKHWQSKNDSKIKSKGQIEFNEYVTFRANGLATPVPIAFGERITAFGITPASGFGDNCLIDFCCPCVNQRIRVFARQRAIVKQHFVHAIGETLSIFAVCVG